MRCPPGRFVSASPRLLTRREEYPEYDSDFVGRYSRAVDVAAHDQSLLMISYGDLERLTRGISGGARGQLPRCPRLLSQSRARVLRSPCDVPFVRMGHQGFLGVSYSCQRLDALAHSWAYMYMLQRIGACDGFMLQKL